MNLNLLKIVKRMEKAPIVPSWLFFGSWAARPGPFGMFFQNYLKDFFKFQVCYADTLILLYCMRRLFSELASKKCIITMFVFVMSICLSFCFAFRTWCITKYRMLMVG